MKNTICYIGLGSNLANPPQQLHTAIAKLSALPYIQVINISQFYQTTPVGPQDQPDFVNAVVAIDTSLNAIDLLSQLQHIEQQQGRIRQQRWGPRTLDLDLLLYGDAIINTPQLTVPHPELLNRRFVIEPLLEIAPMLTLPDGGYLRDLASHLN